MFAADQPETAAEMLRVCRPGGAIAITAFTARGLNGQMFATTARHLKPPPGVKLPALSGDEDHVRALFAGAAGITFELRTYPIVGNSPEAWVEYLSTVLGPLVQTRATLEAEGRWAAARDDLVALYRPTTWRPTARCTRAPSTCWPSSPASGPSRNVSPESPGADHRQAVSSTLEIPPVFLRDQRLRRGTPSLPGGAGIPGFPAQRHEKTTRPAPAAARGPEAAPCAACEARRTSARPRRRAGAPRRRPCSSRPRRGRAAGRRR